MIHDLQEDQGRTCCKHTSRVGTRHGGRYAHPQQRRPRVLHRLADQDKSLRCGRDHTEPRHWFKPTHAREGIWFEKLEVARPPSPVSITESTAVATMRCGLRRRNCSARLDTTNFCWIIFGTASLFLFFLNIFWAGSLACATRCSSWRPNLRGGSFH